jgi:DNA processing protein
MLAPALSQDEELYWVALVLVPGLGPLKAARLLTHFKSPQAVFNATPSELAAHDVPAGIARSISAGVSFDDAVDQQRLMREHGVSLITFHDSCYPALLKSIYDPPLALFARGQLKLLSTAMLAVVGTRSPTAYGVAAATRVAADLASSGLTIASGMARGIDTAAHKAALDAGGGTVAIFGSGIDHIYPAENRALSERIASSGLLLSEFPMGTPGQPQNFPRRNRVVSGISVGVLVVEGAQYSGSAITARLGMDQGREVFAIPGPITSRMSWGPNLLIKQGAKLVQDAEDVLADLNPETRRLLLGTLPAASAQNSDNPLQRLDLLFGPNAPVAKQVLNCLKIEETIQLDDLIDQLDGCSASEIIAVLFEMEMHGLVRQLPGKNFVKVW